MNRAYRVVKNKSKGFAPTVLAASLGLMGSASSAELPTGGSVVAGSGSISQSGTTLTVTQTSPQMAAHWQSFNIGQGHTVNFMQPSGTAAALNRVVGADATVIQGALKANGQVFLVNPNGILFTPTAQVNVGGIVASTLDVSTADFMTGNYKFQGSSSNAIVNQGNITAVGKGGQGGTIALMAAKIINQGSLAANAGNVLLGAGSKVTLDLGGPVKIQVEQGALNALIEQGGAIKADGGLVYLTAKAASDLAGTVINHTGVTEAQTLATGLKGQIVLLGGLDADRIAVGGTLDASAPHGGDGGFIETSAAKVAIADQAKISTAAPQGATGQWLIDPVDFTIAASGGDITGAGLSGLLNSNHVTIKTQTGINTSSRLHGSTGVNGDIHVNDAVAWSAPYKLTLEADRNININADITASHSNGQLALWYGQGGEDGAGASYSIGHGAKVNLRAGVNFFTKQGSRGEDQGWQVITALGAQGSTTGEDLQGLVGYLDGRYVLGADIDASATSGWNIGEDAAGFTPIGDDCSCEPFTGAFDGLGHVISNLYINRPEDSGVGLFGYAEEATIRNVGLVSASITGEVGVGGLVGTAVGGVVTNSYVTGSVSGDVAVGGLVGENLGQISNSYVTGSVSGEDSVGGSVGANYGQISNSYATGSVSGDNAVGGLVGLNYGQASNSYATGAVSGSGGSVGGLVGDGADGSVADSFWNIETSGQPTSAAGTGKTSAEMQSLATYSGWDISSSGGEDTVWRIYEGSTTPWLRSFLTTVTLNGDSASKVYDGLYTVDAASLSWSKDGAPFSVDGGAIEGLYLNSKNVGVHSLSVGAIHSSQQGYDIVDGTGGSLTVNITPKALSISGITASDKTYDGTQTAALDLDGIVYTGLLGEDDVRVSATGLFSDKNAGSNKTVTLTSTAAGEDAGNYVITGQTTALASIGQRQITVVADDKAKVAGQADPVFTWHIAAGELVVGDGLSGSLTRSVGETAGDYTIFAGGLSNGNYLITPVNGVLAIHVAPTPPEPTPPTGGTERAVAIAAAQGMPANALIPSSAESHEFSVDESSGQADFSITHVRVVDGGINLPPWAASSTTN
ncbi:filamentous hemagglutinin N-terminal domain-containing protein [Parapusillimonas sp. SGNA-6]|nr:filamentous hemagglutinin N-terminal domain-containing protein [Parapusillimonas sp. SGNA-6]